MYLLIRLCLVAVKYFPERKIFSSVWLHYENCCRKYFHVFSSILKMLFSYKFFAFSRLFSQHPNKFYYRKFQNHSQIPTPHITETPIQPTAANSGNQNKQPPKQHYHTTTTTTKIKITERDRWVEDQWVEGEIERRGAIWCMRSSDWSSRFADNVEGVIWAPLSAHLARKWFEVKILASNHFQGQSLIFTVNFK